MTALSCLRPALRGLRLAVLGLGLAATALPAAFPNLVQRERFIAIDNACGWPQMVLLPDGNLACILWPQPSHSLTEGAAECWVSTDGGRNWSKAGVPVPYGPTTNRMNHAAGLTRQGKLLVLLSGWNNRKPLGWKQDPADKRSVRELNVGSKTLKPVPAVSTDDGRTWQQFPEVTDPANPERRGTPFGRILPLDEKRLGVFLYSDELAFFTSADEGRTWTKQGVASTDRLHNETTWLRLDNGDLYAAARTGEDRLLHGLRSTDQGKTWKFERELTLPMQHPADLTRLPDGRILLSYGVRNDGRWGIEVRIADAEARVWSPPIQLVDLEGSTDAPDTVSPSRDGGYPTTVVLPDGTLVTAYYSRGVPSHMRYHVGIVRWKLPATAAPSFISQPKS